MDLKQRLKRLFVDACARALTLTKEPEALLDAIAQETRLRSAGHGFAALRDAHNGPGYVVPGDLKRTELPIRRGLVVGSCLAELWVRQVAFPVDFVLVNNLSVLPDQPPLPAGEYDFQIVQIPLRIPLPDAHVWQLPHNDVASYEAAFELSVRRMRDALALAATWNRRHGLLTFVTNFLVPQQNPMGRWMPRYDLRNPMYFVERLNAELETELTNYENAFLLDIDGLAALSGRRYLQDDAFNMIAHGSLWGEDPHADVDANRIEPFPGIATHYDFTPLDDFFATAWRQVEAMLRTLRRTDEVKLVIVDLDDTLWRGVAAEEALETETMVEGWPLGLIEALVYLKKRGVLLAIVSKNEESRIAKLWDTLMRGRLRLDDFAVRKINWQPKVQNIHDVLGVVNVLPKSVVFIDDNPVERAAVSDAFPDIRVLGANPFYLRRILLWSPETQVAGVTVESERRTEMVQSQARREQERAAFPREAFLASLQLEIDFFEVHANTDSRFERVLELINKTNQFNTTGQRRRREEFAPGEPARPRLYGFHVRDRFSDYGIVGAVVLRGNRIEQFVMSCRVLGLDIENTVLNELATTVRDAGNAALEAVLVETEANFPCRDLYARCGFACTGEIWSRPLTSPLSDRTFAL